MHCVQGVKAQIVLSSFQFSQDCRLSVFSGSLCASSKAGPDQQVAPLECEVAPFEGVKWRNFKVKVAPLQE